MLSTDDHKLKTTHLERTAHLERDQEKSEAVVVDIRDESPLVKGLTLNIKNKFFTHKPGQWVDAFLPGLETVGGFSICSAPHKLLNDKQIDLAVKLSEHPPAAWIHQQCKVGDKILLRVGGDFFLDASQLSCDVLLIAGGVGINPLHSMLSHIHHIRQSSTHQVTLLYSAKSLEELIFKTGIDEIKRDNHYTDVQYFVTQSTEHSCQDVANRRICCSDIEKVISKMNTENLEIYLCGPLSMIMNMKDMIMAKGISETKIHYEKWY